MEQTEKIENVWVTADDIKMIGNTQFKDEETGFLSIICDINTVHLEEIFLRSILRCFGNQYVITDTEDFIRENDGKEEVEILVKTNLPGELVF